MRLNSYLYDSTYSPAMPVVEVKLVAPHSGASVGPIRALVDSGADGTLDRLTYWIKLGY